MSQETLRSAFRAHTAEIHERLDRIVGDLSSADAYRLFVARSYAFRSAVERTDPDFTGWRTLNLAAALRDDLDDLEFGELDIPQLEASSWPSANLGRLYVLEGSSVGARLLYQRARGLGFTASFGARHLAMQVDDVARWKRFIALMDAADQVDRSEALSAAHELFEFALQIYSGDLHGRG